MSARRIFWIVLGVTILVWGGSLGYLFFWPQAKAPQPVYKRPPVSPPVSPSPRDFPNEETVKKVLEELKPPPFAILAGTLVDIDLSQKTLSFIASSWEESLEYPYTDETPVFVLEQEITSPQDLLDLFPKLLAQELPVKKISFSQLVSDQNPNFEEKFLLQPKLALVALKQKEALVYEPVLFVLGK